MLMVEFEHIDVLLYARYVILQCDEGFTNACEQVCHLERHQSYHVSTNTNKVGPHVCVRHMCGYVNVCYGRRREV